MKPVICNASPIIALSGIGSLHVLNELFRPVFVPEAVYKEVATKKNGGPGSAELLRMLENDVFRLYHVENQNVVQQLYGKLHFGEIEVMVAAKELAVIHVVLDDRSARKLAQTMLLQPIGTLGILRLAKQEGIIKSLKPLVDGLINNNFRISKGIYEEIMRDD